MNALNNVKIGAKMIGSFLSIAILLVVIGVMGFLNMKNINDGMTTMYVDRLLPVSQLGQADSAFYKVRGEVYKFILLPDQRATIEQELYAQIGEVDKSMKAYRATFLVKEEKDELAKYDLTWPVYQKAVAAVLAKTKAGNDKEALVLLGEDGAVSTTRKPVAASIDKLGEINVNVADELNKQGDATFAGATLAIGVLSAIAVILAVVIGIVLTRSIASPLGAISRVAQQIAAGDLSVNVPSEQRTDEVGILAQAFRQLVEKLRRSTADISQAVSLLGSSASEILAATTQVACSTAETATAISETTTTVEEVRQAAQLSSQKAQSVSDSAQRVAQISQTGQKAVEETSVGMNRIREQMETIAQTVVRLSEQSQSIGGIIASVTDLADQSNLLAVNAAIEAAKAGEQGKGFAVVAQEIKSLAEQSKQATAQVRSILSDVQKATSAAVMATEQGSKAVEAGVKQSAQAGEAIRVLAETSGEATQTATQIVASSQQQVVGMDQIGTAMENINQAGAQNATSMKQMEIAAQNLHGLGQKLKDLVTQFKV